MPSKNKTVHHHQVVAPLHMKGRELGEDNEDDEREVDDVNMWNIRVNPPYER